MKFLKVVLASMARGFNISLLDESSTAMEKTKKALG